MLLCVGVLDLYYIRQSLRFRASVHYWIWTNQNPGLYFPLYFLLHWKSAACFTIWFCYLISFLLHNIYTSERTGLGYQVRLRQFRLLNWSILSFLFAVLTICCVYDSPRVCSAIKNGGAQNKNSWTLVHIPSSKVPTFFRLYFQLEYSCFCLCNFLLGFTGW